MIDVVGAIVEVSSSSSSSNSSRNVDSCGDRGLSITSQVHIISNSSSSYSSRSSSSSIKVVESVVLQVSYLEELI